MSANLLKKIARIITPSGDDFAKAGEVMRAVFALPEGEHIEIGPVMVVHNEDDTWTVADNGDSQEAKDFFDMKPLLESFLDEAIEELEKKDPIWKLLHGGRP